VKRLGKQRSKILRRNAEAIYNMFKDRFGTDFEKNKKVLDEMKIFQNKLNRNIVAGCIVSLARVKEL
jgi:ribosomal protein S17E